MGGIRVNIFDISDMQWPRSGKCATTNGIYNYYTGNDDRHHRCGVVILMIVEKEINR